MAQKDREAAERRKKAAEEAKVNRSLKAAAGENSAADNAILDDLINQLKKGITVSSKRHKARKTNGKASAVALEADSAEKMTEPKFESKPPADGDKTADLARDMLAALQSDGFAAFTPTTPSARSDRSTRPLCNKHPRNRALQSDSRMQIG